jgi:riboflavin synthase
MNSFGEICSMFTGIIERTGIVKEAIVTGTNKSFWIESPLSSELKVDQSVSHNGVCLTVEDIRENRHRVTAIDETLKKTNLEQWSPGTIVNIERCLPINGRLDGHFVQGHVDTTGTCVSRTDKNGSSEFVIEFPKKFAELIIEKGSICLNGISLTAYNVGINRFTVAIIPYTLEHTNVKNMKPGDRVNLEFDMLGKYINRKISLPAI